MAKQIVREFDNSTGSLPAYSNFTVLVPGYVSSDKFKDVSDENDAYEVNSVEAFTENVGLVCGKAVEAEAPTTTEPAKFTVNSAAQAYNRGTLYKVVAKAEPDDKVGYLEDNNNTYLHILDFTDVAFDDETLQTLDIYCEIEQGKEGRDAIQGDHMGNQIAYTLLTLGYTVLYKGFGPKTHNADATPKALEGDDFWSPFRDKSTYQFRYVVTGGYYEPAAMNAIIRLATFNNKVTLEEAETILDSNGRGDIIALCDVDEDLFDQTSRGTTANIYNTNHAASYINTSKYAAIFAPRVIYNMSVPTEYESNTTFPASFHYLACAAYAQSRFAEWYAVSGYPRGISTLSVAGTTVNYGNIAQNTLAPRVKLTLDATTNTVVDRAVNLIINERGSYYLWGNRTAEVIDEKGLRWSHYLNIRQLCTTIKKQVIYIGRMYAFDPNSDVLWNNFKAGVEPLLRRMAGDQGLDAYKITPVKDKVKGAVKAKIRIVPIEAAEDFDISLYLEDSISSATVDAVESD